MKRYYAHTSPKGKDPKDKSTWQTLLDHLKGVATLAEKFASKFGMGKEGKSGGGGHDVAKVADAFQLKLENGDWHTPVNHSSPGAFYFLQNNRIPEALITEGHHIGLPDYTTFVNTYKYVTTEFAKGNKQPMIECFKFDQSLQDIIGRMNTELNMGSIKFDGLWSPSKLKNSIKNFSDSIRIRMLSSCVTDSDWLNTEEHMDPDRFNSRKEYPLNPEEACKNLAEYISKKQENAVIELQMCKKCSRQEIVYKSRNSVLDQCIAQSGLPKGIYTLTSPTGSGKTLSAFSFAFNHAKLHKMDRIIYIVHYLAILEQTSSGLKDALKPMGDSYILEHHSDVTHDENNENIKEIKVSHNLGTENWEWPVIFTSNTQFFESLFSNSPKKCRKLHNIVNSVLIFDESHLLPMDKLKSFLLAIKILVEEYNCTVLFMSATQPAFEYCAEKLGIEFKFSELISNSEQLTNDLSRVKFVVKQKPVSWDTVASWFKKYPQYYCVVNTKRDARTLYDLIDSPHKFLLYTNMCAKQRKHILDQVKYRLKYGMPCYLVATQLIENGCDIDFIYGGCRVMGPLDAIIQSGGRCGRNGILQKKGTFIIFNPIDPHFPKGDYERITNISYTFIKANLNPKDANFTSPDVYKEYYKLLYERMSPNSDEIFKYSCQLNFPKVAEVSKLIENVTIPILVPYNNEAKQLIELLKHIPYVNKELMRKCQQYTINLYEWEFNKNRALIQLTSKSSNIYYWTGDYSNDVGLVSDLIF